MILPAVGEFWWKIWEVSFRQSHIWYNGYGSSYYSWMGSYVYSCRIPSCYQIQCSEETITYRPKVHHYIIVVHVPCLKPVCLPYNTNPTECPVMSSHCWVTFGWHFGDLWWRWVTLDRQTLDRLYMLFWCSLDDHSKVTQRSLTLSRIDSLSPHVVRIYSKFYPL